MYIPRSIAYGCTCTVDIEVSADLLMVVLNNVKAYASILRKSLSVVILGMQERNMEVITMTPIMPYHEENARAYQRLCCVFAANASAAFAF